MKAFPTSNSLRASLPRTPEPYGTPGGLRVSWTGYIRSTTLTRPIWHDNHYRHNLSLLASPRRDKRITAAGRDDAIPGFAFLRLGMGHLHTYYYRISASRKLQRRDITSAERQRSPCCFQYSATQLVKIARFSPITGDPFRISN